MSKLFLSWSDVEAMCHVIANDISLRLSSDAEIHIVALARGGWIPARMIGGLLESSFAKVSYQSVHAKSYTGLEQGKLTIDDFTIPPCHYALLIDDLVDSGDTMNAAAKIAIKSGYSKVATAVLIAKSSSKHQPNYSAMDIGEQWVVFPYETEGV